MVYQRRRNFRPALIITAFSWLTVAGTVFFVSPEPNWTAPLAGLLVNLFLALGLTLALLLGNSKRGFALAGLIVLLLLAKALLSRQN